MSTQIAQELPLSQLIFRKQVRQSFDEESLEGLTQSIREVGVQQPVRVRREGDKFVVIAGERRVRASCKAGRTSVPAVIECEELSEGQIVQRQIICDCQREDLKPLEKARAIQRLIETTGWSATVVAQKLGLSNATVSRALPLLKLPQAIQAQLERGEIAASAAYELARIEGTEAQAALAAELASGRLTRDGISGRRKVERTTTTAATASHRSRQTAILDGDRSLTFTGPCQTLEELIAWLEELLGKARKVRPQGIELLTFLKMLKDQAKTATTSKV